jgi:hypothetical protein
VASCGVNCNGTSTCTLRCPGESESRTVTGEARCD